MVLRSAALLAQMEYVTDLRAARAMLLCSGTCCGTVQPGDAELELAEQQRARAVLTAWLA